MNLKEIETRVSEIKDELKNGNLSGEELENRNKELDELMKNRDKLIKEGEQRKAMLDKIGTLGTVVESGEERKAAEPEYRTVFFKNLRGDELTQEEKRVLATGITGNTSGTGTSTSGQSLLVPTETLDYIWNLVSERHSILEDIQIYRSGVVMEIPVHTAGSGASLVAEGVAPSEESNTFAKVTLAGKDFAKYVDITYAMERMAIPALERYIADEIATAIGDALAKDVIDTIMGNVASGNKMNKSAPTYKDICDMFGNIDRADEVVVYAKRSTIYGKLVGMTTTDGKPVFQLAPAERAVGTILGALIKIEDAVPDGAILIGDGNQVVMNIVQDVMIETDRDIKKHTTTYSGYARAEAALVNTKAYAYCAEQTVSA